MALQLRLELLERSGVAFFHSRLEQWRRELEETAGLGLHHQPYVCARAVVAQLPVAGRSHRSRSRLHARATPGELVVRLELRPLEGPFHAAALHLVAVDVSAGRIARLLVGDSLEVVHVVGQVLSVRQEVEDLTART